MAQEHRVAIDVGGTFTDVVVLDPITNELRFDKVPTTPKAATTGVITAYERGGVAMPDVEMFTHGTTLGLNALLTRTGAKTAVIATHGFRDVYLLGRTDRRTNYDITYHKATPLLERYDTFEVTERCLFDGSVAQDLDLAEAEAVAEEIRTRGYEAVAVAFIHAYANPDHERQMRDVLHRVAPNVAVTLSHELSREYREYERTSTAVLDAYTKPLVCEYLDELHDKLDAGGFEGRFLMTRSSGGAMTARSAMESPVNLILSGPAGGVIGAAAMSEIIGFPNLITIDMGGTSLDASLILDSEPVLYQGAEFEGLPINTPSLYIHTIGAGGGSIASLDAAGALQVGPQSAGASPGPASYGSGGDLPTFTDAALVIGYLGSDVPLGGTLTLDTALAEKALTGIAERLGLSVRALARGIVGISVTKIMGAVRAITVDLGRDPQDFALLSFGGGGGLVSVDVAHELGIPTVVVPPGQGAFSAFGMLLADVQHDYSRTTVMPLDEVDDVTAGPLFTDMQQVAATQLENEGFKAERQRYARTLDVRYVGQEHSVSLAYPNPGQDVVATITRDFTELHQRQYGHVMDDPIEITTLRLRATGLVQQPTLPRLASRDEGAPTPVSQRAIYIDEGRPAVPYDVYHREDLLAGDAIAGPAVIAEHTATTVLHDGDRLDVGSLGELVITLKQKGA